MNKYLVVALLAVAAACGGGKDKKNTTPGDTGAGTGGQDPTGMNDGGGTPGGGDTGGTPGGGGDGVGDGGGGTTGPKPIIRPPDLDPDPAAAKSEVDRHLKIARQMLAENPPNADGALGEAKQALGVDAASVDAAVVIAHAYVAKKLYDTAEVMLDELLKRPSAKDNASLYYVLGLVYDKQRKKAEAQLAYNKAIALDGEYASARINLGVHQLANKQYDDAASTYEKVVSLGRNDAEIQNSLGAAYRGQSGNYDPGTSQRMALSEKAEQAFRQAIKLDANYAPAYYNLGLLFLDTDKMGGLSTLDRLTTAKKFFDQYKNAPGFDLALFDDRTKDVDKAIKREEKRLKREEKERKAAAKEAAGGDK
jgi:tetratricopeptide (TPR) repeat protein